MEKPEWLRKKINISDFLAQKKRLKKYQLNTICEEASCPNISECFSHRIATFLISGNICTRSCGFCKVQKGIPKPLAPDEHTKIAFAIKELNLNHAVITSVSRDDLPDRGLAHFIKTIKQIKQINKNTRVEALIPDFDGNKKWIKYIAHSGADIIAHNVETVKRLYPYINRKITQYDLSLSVLKMLKEYNKRIITKSGFMLGMGEKEEEILETMKDIRHTGCHFLSIGQYLSPSKKHVPVSKYLRPNIFKKYRSIAFKIGFSYVKSGPFVRSSYLADEYSSRE